MRVKLYAIPLSHPAIAARLMLEHKGIEHEVLELTSGFHRWILRALGFAGGTVPALKVDGRRIEGSLRISRLLEELEPEPPLFPDEPEDRRHVEEAERWGEAELQPIPRRLARWSLVRNPGFRRRLAELNELPLPGLAARTMYPIAVHFARLSGADDPTVRDDLARLPGLLDRLDGLVEEGTIGGETPNAADFQIGTSVRSLLGFDDLRDFVDGRPAADLARRLVPPFAGTVPPSFPADWLPAA